MQYAVINQKRFFSKLFFWERIPEENRPLVLTAYYYNKLSALVALLELKADPLGADYYQNNIFHYTALYNNWAGIEVIIKYGAAKLDTIIDAKNNEGETALHIAAKKNHLLIVEKLVNFKANIEETNNKGQTPLLAAAESKALSSFRKLIDLRANPCAADHQGNNLRMKLFVILQLGLIKGILLKS